MLPAATVLAPVAPSARARNSVSVVFPFVPVTATIRPLQNREAKSISAMQMQPDLRAQLEPGVVGGNPGEKTARPCPRAASGVNSRPLRS
jgi:hypothetical protein